MEEDELRKALITAQGEAMFAGLVVGSLVTLLTKKGVLKDEETERLLDGLMLILERQRAMLPPDGQAAVDHARSRAEATLRMSSSKPR
ncbi:hypothetical protein [Roseomonas chloroacetimidivorans]|uniref:hypothetical protein n=1 Tax=Roseomonas chloroacetimidivorans TaxID=1766656 RepID=UPI003C78D1BF